MSKVNNKDLSQLLEEIKTLMNDAITMVDESAPKEQVKKRRANGR